MNPNSRKSIFILVVITVLALVQRLPVSAQTSVVIDGSFADWASEASFVDSGGDDDEASPTRADITEFRAASDSSAVYLLKAWDDTNFTGGLATTSGVTLRTAGNAYYRIYTTAENVASVATVTLESLDINSCTDSTCQSQSPVCEGTGCAGVQAGSSPTWADPFAGRLDPGCSGTNCETLDTAVELYIPWDIVGGAPADGQYVFLQFGSYPSGPAQAPKDEVGSNGIACSNTGGTFVCFPATPTQLTMKSFTASSSITGGMTSSVISFSGFLFILATGALLRRRNSPR